MKIKILFSLIFGIMGLCLGNAQNTLEPDVTIEFVPEIPANGLIPAADTGISNPFFVIQPSEDGVCCSAPNIDCCEVGVTWNVNTNAIPPGLYSSFKLTAKWCGRDSCLIDTDSDSSNDLQSVESYSADAGIVLRSSSFDEGIRFIKPSSGGKVNSRKTTIIFDGDFPILLDPNANDLQIDFVQWFAEDVSRWSNVVLELFKADDNECSRPSAITDVAITSNSYTFNWDPPLSDTPDSYTWQILPYSNDIPREGCPIAQGSTTETTATANNLLPDVPYVLQIQSVCNDETSESKEKLFLTIDDGTPPANDKIENAIPIVTDCDLVGDFFIVTGNTRSATLDEQEKNFPQGFTALGSLNYSLDTPTVWYSYTGNGIAEKVRIELCRTEDDDVLNEITTLGYLTDSEIFVYTGTPENLKLVAVPNDYTCGTSEESQADIDFISDGTSTYYISIDSLLEIQSDFVDNPDPLKQVGYFRMDISVSETTLINPPSNDDTTSAKVLELNIGVIQDFLLGATPSYDVDMTTRCETLDGAQGWRDVWYEVELTEFSDLTVTVLDFPNQNTVFALYSDSDGNGGVTYEDIIVPFKNYERPDFFGENEFGVDIGEIDLCDNTFDSFQYQCLSEGKYFIRVFTDNKSTETFGIKAEVEPSVGNLASPGVLAIDKSLVFLDEVTGTADIVVKQEILANVPDGFVNLNVLWKEIFDSFGPLGYRDQETLINIEDPIITYVVDEAGSYKVSNSVFNDGFELGTGDYLEKVIEKIGNTSLTSCAGINEGPTIIEVRSACKADAAVGILEPVTTPVIITGEPVTIEARQAGTPPDVLENYDITYVLTSGTELTILATSSTPSFQVSEGGTYRIHTLVAETSDDIDLNFLDLSTVNFGTTTADQILETVENNGLCGALDVVGATIKVTGNTLSSAGVKDNGFTVMPNPVKNSLSVSAKASIDSVIIYNMQGQSILRINPNTMQSEIDMSGLANGLYFIEVAINNTRETVRIVKQ